MFNSNIASHTSKGLPLRLTIALTSALSCAVLMAGALSVGLVYLYVLALIDSM